MSTALWCLVQLFNILQDATCQIKLNVLLNTGFAIFFGDCIEGLFVLEFAIHQNN